MGEMRENVAVVQTCHSDLRDDHLQESGECREDTKLVLVESESSCSREVASLHDAGADEDLGVLLVDDLQPSGALQIAFLNILADII